MLLLGPRTSSRSSEPRSNAGFARSPLAQGPSGPGRRRTPGPAAIPISGGPSHFDAVREVEGRWRAESGRVAVPDLVIAHAPRDVGTADRDRRIGARRIRGGPGRVHLGAQADDAAAGASQAVAEPGSRTGRGLDRALIEQRGAVGHARAV